MSGETTLLPCPFCGGEADEYEGEYGNGIYCMMCGAKMGEPIHLGYRTMKRVSIDEAIAAWNTRAELGSTCPFSRPTDLTDGCAALERIAELEAELGSGMLTAEQVREAIERNFGKVVVIDDGGEKVEWREGWVCNVGINYKAIADELNAELGGGTCEYVIEDNMNESEGMGDVWFRCTNCCTCYDYYADDWLLKMPHCPKCGAVVEGVR